MTRLTTDDLDRIHAGKPVFVRLSNNALDMTQIHAEYPHDSRQNHELRAAIQLLRLAEYDAEAEGQPEQARKIRAAIDAIVKEVRR